MCNEMKMRDADILSRLDKAGFMLEFGEDNTGLMMKPPRGQSSFYIDIGGSELVASGKIKLKSRVEIERFKDNTILLNDGSELIADIVVFATGYHSFTDSLADLISKDVADRVGKCDGLGSATPGDPGPWEGERRNLWKPTKQESLWIHGVNFSTSRYYSKYLALQLKARMEGLPTPVYG